MKDRFADAAEQIMKFKLHRDLYVRKMVITLVPTLAVYDTETFSELHLHPAMAYLMTQLDTQYDKATGIPTSLGAWSSLIHHSPRMWL